MLNSKYLMFIITGFSLVSVKTYPEVFTRLSGRDTWLAVAAAMTFILGYIGFLVWVCQKKDCYSVARIYRLTLGPLFGNIMLGFFLLSAVFTVIECTTVEASAMHEHFLLGTPTAAFIASLMAVGIYVATLGFQTVVTTVLIHIAGTATVGMNLFVLVAKYKNYDYLFPFMADGLTADFVLSVIKLIGAYSSIVFILLFLSRVSDKENLLKYTVLGIVFVAQNQIVCMIGTITTFSLPWLNSMFYPKLLQTQLVSHFDFMEAGELFVLYQVVAGWLLKYILCFFVTLQLLRLIGMSKKMYYWMGSVIIFFAAYYISTNVFRVFVALDYFLYISFVNLFVIPLLIFTFFLFKSSFAVPIGDASVSGQSN